MCMCVGLSVWMLHMCAGTKGGQKRHTVPWDWSLGSYEPPNNVGNKSRSSVKIASVLNH